MSTLTTFDQNHPLVGAVRYLGMIEVRCLIFSDYLLIYDIVRLVSKATHNTYIYGFNNTIMRFIYQCLCTHRTHSVVKWEDENRSIFIINDIEELTKLWAFIRNTEYHKHSIRGFYRI